MRVILPFTAQLLKSQVTGYGPLGNTPTGQDWCLKALHPSDPLCEVRGIPDHSAVPSLCMNYQTTYTISPQADWTQDTWEFDMALLPHPIAFGWINTRPTGAPLSGHTYTVLNSQLDGVTHANKAETFASLVERWRLAYCAVSVYQDGADLNNQGTMVVAQVPCEPVQFVYTGYDLAVRNSLYGYPPVQFWDRDKPDFEASQGMPNAYFGRSKEGAYVPLKLTETCQEWSSARDVVYYSYGAEEALPALPTNIELPTVGADAIFPFGDGEDAGGALLNGLTIAIGNSIDHGALGKYPYVSGEPTFDMLNGTMAHISARNLAKSTSYSFFFRVGLEIQVKPNSALAPQMKLSPPYDPVALDSYFAIARELKDGYPVDYNDRGKLWGVIKQAASVALPMLNMAGPYGKAAATLGMGALALGDSIQNRAENLKSGGRDRPPLAAVERAKARRAAKQTAIRVKKTRPRSAPRRKAPTFEPNYPAPNPPR